MRQTTTINGKRQIIMARNGKLTLKPAPVLEWRLQAACVSALRSHPAYGRSFTVAGDFNAARRGKQEATKAIATGLTAGEPDLRVYMVGGRLGLIEYKAGNGRLSQEQRDRHALLVGLGFDVVVIRAKDEQEAANATLAVVDTWLGMASNGGLSIAE